jgi:hypothetical protein
VKRGRSTWVRGFEGISDAATREEIMERARGHLLPPG